MKKLSLLALLVVSAVLFARHSVASDVPVFRILSNGDAGATTALVPGTQYAVQCDVAHRLAVGDDAGTLANQNYEKIEADRLFDVPLTGEERYISTVPVTGATGTCTVFKVNPRQTKE